MYNTDKQPIQIREYGRNVQKLLAQAHLQPSPAHRQRYIEILVKMIEEMHPSSLYQPEEYRLRIWSHLMQMTNYTLDVQAPGPLIDHRQKTQEPPHTLSYPRKRSELKQAQYGRNVQNLIQKALAVESPQIRSELVNIIASYMKLAYNSWGREIATDEVIYEDIEALSQGQIQLKAKNQDPYQKGPKRKTANYNVKTNTGNAPLKVLTKNRPYGTQEQSQSMDLPPMKKYYNKYNKKR